MLSKDTDTHQHSMSGAEKAFPCGEEFNDDCQRRPQNPTPAEEFRKIEEYHPILASTGCSSRFCQSGRMIHIDEPRVGKDHPLHQIDAEALSFLEQMKRDNGFSSETDFQNRVKEVLKEVNRSKNTLTLAPEHKALKAVNTELAGDVSSRSWVQTAQELEYGVRLAWKHSRKCIMRSQYKNLRLCDLRHIKTSAEMGKALVQRLKEAFNGGDILPTVFVFPAREAGKSGPMIWNQQLLAFAGYTREDGSVLGDPVNASLTASIMELGWKPPEFRTKWDILPLVTMAEEDGPVITDIPKDDFPLVHIRHPRHGLAFEKLGLRWVPAPALSQLGFDIGGVQYTASPFIGWFMDAEIGVRDLADVGRYNVLPDVVKALYPDELHRPLEQLRECERLNLLCRAQTELNFAVFHSFSQAGVRMSDTLTASSNYCQFDDDHLKRYGFRLPADPYWLAPPQGSIIPIWHRGGSPHYQPKPMICRHRENPVKAWKRRQIGYDRPSQGSFGPVRKSTVPADGPCDAAAKPKVLVYHCTTGTIAVKLANAVYGSLRQYFLQCQQKFRILRPQPLSSLNLFKLSPDDVVIIIASSTGRGEVPPDGQSIIDRLRKSNPAAARFAVFGNGDSSYPDTFNGAARMLHDSFRNAGCRPLNDSYVEGDNAKESPPWNRLDAWSKSLPQQIQNPRPYSNGIYKSVVSKRSPPVHYQDIIRSYSRLRLESCTVNRGHLRKVQLSTRAHSYSAMDYLQVLPPNEPEVVRQVLRALRKKGHDRILALSGMKYYDFLKELAELKRPFRDMEWTGQLSDEGVDIKVLAKQPVIDVLRALPSGWQRNVEPDDVLLSMPVLTPRTFSIASIPDDSEKAGMRCKLELLVQAKRSGQFSERYLDSAKAGDFLRCRVRRGTELRKLCNKETGSIVAFITGSGLAPMQSLLRFRAQKIRQFQESGDISLYERQISLFIGFHSEDSALIHEGIDEAVTSGLIDMLCLMPSNELQARVQDKVFEPGTRERIEAKIRNGAHVFVCANKAAATDVTKNLSAILGCDDLQQVLGEKYIQDTFSPAPR
ncbi:MAG: Nitric oxide synthase, brain [Bogoriella megaspora]|nr:MAG: Nitric oxide synthase, brain [Bogoriella megaspora]